MEQSFLLKHHARLSLFEQNNMTSEERAWWIKRVDEENKRREEVEKKVFEGSKGKK